MVTSLIFFSLFCLPFPAGLLLPSVGLSAGMGGWGGGEDDVIYFNYSFSYSF